jgi:hypothetical protein
MRFFDDRVAVAEIAFSATCASKKQSIDAPCRPLNERVSGTIGVRAGRESEAPPLATEFEKQTAHDHGEADAEQCVLARSEVRLQGVSERCAHVTGNGRRLRAAIRC